MSLSALLVVKVNSRCFGRQSYNKLEALISLSESWILEDRPTSTHLFLDTMFAHVEAEVVCKERLLM